MKSASGYGDLPSELIEVIFDELWNARSSERKFLLRNCLPVSIDFRHRILSRFCRDIHLSLTSSHRRITRLREVISQPLDSRLGGIGRYVKGFFLELTVRHYTQTFRDIIQFLDNQDLAAIIEGLHGEHFGVAQFFLIIHAHTPDSPEKSLAWGNIPAGFRSAFQTLLQSPYLTDLSLQNIAFLPENIFNGSHLKDLSIRQAPHVWVAGSPGIKIDLASASVFPFPSLVELHTDHSYKCDSNFLPGSMLDKLKVFREFRNGPLHSENTWHVLGLSASSLTEIHIQHCGEPTIIFFIFRLLSRTSSGVTGDVVNPPEAFNLGLVPNLKYFQYTRYSSTLHPFDSYHDQTPLIIFQLFNVTKPMEHLNIIDIGFDLHEGFTDDLFLRKTITDARWALLDSVLADGLWFPYLSKFGLEIALTGTPYFKTQDFTRTMNELLLLSFPCVLAKKSISFNPTTVPY